MASLSRFFSRYTGFLRSLKIVYVINNLLNRQKLQHNKELYKKYGLKRSIFGNIGSHDFKPSDLSEEIPWLDRPNALERLTQHPDFEKLPTEWQGQLRQFIQEGYMVLKGFYSPEEVDRLNKEVDGLLQNDKAGFNYTGRKIMDAHLISSVVDQHYFRNQRLLRLLNFAMGRPVVPFQTINFVQGSEQKAHSDSIHMSTEPAGYLIAAWTALEDMHEGNGPLFYHPGSHRLPYVTCQDYASGNTRWQLGKESYKKYEDKIEAIVQQSAMPKKYFLGNKGDVFVWHANLLHGGSPISQEGSSRKSMVAHYFCEGVICYHEISQRPALLKV
ncbi:MAG: phytanoyl-CoA dioxygenase family protein [Bacteroidota bacterium]